MNHIFFDLDRTLWDFELNSKETLIEIYERYNLSNLGIDNYHDFIKKYKIINEELWDLYRKNKISQNKLREYRFQKTLEEYNIYNINLARQIGDEYIEICPRKNKLFPKTQETLNYLKKKYVLHIITNGFHKTQHIKLKHSNLNNYFNQIITSEDAGVKKPNPKIFEYALAKAKAKSLHSIYVGDDLIVDIEGCQKCGIDGVYFNPSKKKHNYNPKFEIDCLSILTEIF
tara:strand:+ start:1454 stop:2140 length:687 start_codon:yes stop_codon:yes gene_type:complete